MNRWGEKKYEYNLKKAYALVLSYCSKVMQNIIETSPTHQSTIQESPIELLNTTELIMHNPEITKYYCALLTEALHRILNMKKHEKENLIYYTNGLKQASGIFKYHVGPDILEKFIENTEEYRNITDEVEKR